MTLPHSPINISPSLLPASVERNLHARTHLHDLIYVILPLWPRRVDFISLHNGHCFTLKLVDGKLNLFRQLQHPRVEYWKLDDEIFLWAGDDKRVARALILMEVTKGDRI